MITARHSGKLGDIVFSIPAIRALGITLLYIPECSGEASGLYSGIGRFMRSQGIHVERYPVDGLPYMVRADKPAFNIDLDRHRLHAGKGEVNMIARYAEVFRVTLLQEPWLDLKWTERPVIEPYNLIHVTPRHRGKVDWAQFLERIGSRIATYFIGLPEERDAFCAEIGRMLPRPVTNDVLEFATWIHHASTFWCNQSLGLAIAQGLGRRYAAEIKTGKTNCIFSGSKQLILQ